MAQTFDVPHHMLSLARDLGLTQTGPGQFTEFYIGERMVDLHKTMDRRADELRDKIAAQPVHRTKIGRNTTCPCGSGLKFKKCCIGKAVISIA